jgi:hypothetical protein
MTVICMEKTSILYQLFSNLQALKSNLQQRSQNNSVSSNYRGKWRIKQKIKI